jgi:hypothetical protein
VSECSKKLRKLNVRFLLQTIVEGNGAVLIMMTAGDSVEGEYLFGIFQLNSGEWSVVRIARFPFSV